MGPGPPGWGLSVVLSSSRKKLSLRDQKCGLGKVSGGPLWRRRRALGCSANAEEESMNLNSNKR